MHPDKTYFGKVAKGFDWLGFHCCPTGITVSEAALSRRDKKLARLYEQKASKKHIALYLALWLGWAMTGCVRSAKYCNVYWQDTVPPIGTGIMEENCTGDERWRVGEWCYMREYKRVAASTPPVELYEIRAKCEGWKGGGSVWKRWNEKDGQYTFYCYMDNISYSEGEIRDYEPIEVLKYFNFPYGKCGDRRGEPLKYRVK
jgi:hypothetical protein